MQKQKEQNKYFIYAVYFTPVQERIELYSFKLVTGKRKQREINIVPVLCCN